MATENGVPKEEQGTAALQFVLCNKQYCVPRIKKEIHEKCRTHEKNIHKKSAENIKERENLKDTYTLKIGSFISICATKH